MQPLSERMLTDIDEKNMAKESPILVRIFKQESELEIWKEDKTGRFALLKTYPICRWSGDLGPKIKQGDRQAPEGFYTITPGLMNPNSNYYLAINTGFPNAYDRANGRTGAFLMIHGDCSSAGCYAMTDEQVAEIYALARESFFGGQKSFQIQAYPFKMTPLNMAKHRNSPNMAFWKMLKEGYDHFEITRHEPKVDVCEKRYVFDAESSSKFSAADRCPAYKVPDDLVAAVRDKQRRDDTRTAELINRGTPAAPVKMGVDGGMNPTFLAAVKSHGGPGATIRTAIGTNSAARQPTGRDAFLQLDLWHHEPCFGRVETGARAAFVGAGCLGGKFGRFLQQSVRIEERGPRRHRGRRARENEIRRCTGQARTHHHRREKARADAGRSEDCECGCGQTFTAAKAGSERRVAEQRDHDHQPAQRGCADHALQRLRRPLWRVALVWRFRSPHHFRSKSEMRTSEPKPH